MRCLELPHLMPHSTASNAGCRVLPGPAPGACWETSVGHQHPASGEGCGAPAPMAAVSERTNNKVSLLQAACICFASSADAFCSSLSFASRRCSFSSWHQHKHSQLCKRSFSNPAAYSSLCTASPMPCICSTSCSYICHLTLQSAGQAISRASQRGAQSRTCDVLPWSSSDDHLVIVILSHTHVAYHAISRHALRKCLEFQLQQGLRFWLGIHNASTRCQLFHVVVTAEIVPCLKVILRPTPTFGAASCQALPRPGCVLERTTLKGRKRAWSHKSKIGLGARRHDAFLVTVFQRLA